MHANENKMKMKNKVYIFFLIRGDFQYILGGVESNQVNRNFITIQFDQLVLTIYKQL